MNLEITENLKLQYASNLQYMKKDKSLSNRSFISSENPISFKYTTNRSQYPVKKISDENHQREIF